MNKVILMGRLTRDPEIRYTQGSEPLAIVRFGIAVNRKFKREGEPDADFINCVVFGKTGEFTSKYFKKGLMVCVTGRISVNNWTDKDGNKRTSTEVIVEEAEFAESKASFQSRVGGSGEQAAVAAEPQSNNQQPEDFYSVESSVDDDDLPF